VVEEVDARLAASGGLSFDTLLTTTLEQLQQRPALVEQVRQQFAVALVDEFQDTDPVQWDIFRLLFGPGAPSSTLILVGDPKQAIYSFRGGDVYTYLRAKEDAETTTLTVNQRSDERVVRAMNALGTGEQFGNDRIPYVPVTSSPRHRGRELLDHSGAPMPGVQVRCVVDATGEGEDVATATVRSWIAKDLADQVVALLNGPEDAGGTGAFVQHDDEPPRPLRPGHIAVLVAAARESDQLVTELRARGVPVVVRAGDNVAGSPAAEQWRTLLHALDRPADTRRALAAALSWFIGWTAGDVAAAIGDEDVATERLAALQVSLRHWATVLNEQGVPALFETVRRSEHLLGRLLLHPLGERNLTDLEHVAELLHAAAPARRGVSASHALGLLDTLSATASDDVARDAAQRRIESDAEAVQIMTMHGSKGLEFPVVLLPGLWSGGTRTEAKAPFSFFDEETDERVLEVGKLLKAHRDLCDGADDVFRATLEQKCGDQHRLTYVAMTRGAHLTVVWWPPQVNPKTHAELTGLGRLLFGAEGAGPAELVATSFGPAAADAVRSRVETRGASDAVGVVEVPLPLAPVLRRFVDPSVVAGRSPLVVASVGRPLARDTYKWSFTQLSNAIVGPGARFADGDAADEFAADRGAGDEPADAAAAGPVDHSALGAGWELPPVLDGVGSGTSFGTMMHELFEHLDFTTADVPAVAAEWLRTQQKFRVSDEQVDRIPPDVERVLETPLGPHFGGLRQRDLGTADRLNELNFFFPLAGSSASGGPAAGSVAARRIGALVHDYLDAADPLRPWAAQVARGLSHVNLSGMLNGSVDLVLRTTVEGQEQFSVVDYKTNRLTSRGDEPCLADYRPEVLPGHMAHSHYPLQSLLYSVVLHRYLRWRLPEYDPDLHLGPVGYLFVRGMVGAHAPVDPDTGVPSGVFSWPLPPGMVPALSDLLAGLAPDEGVRR
ncbi:MAG: UvrD-helicase domain-containing protein, partial [Actinomycetes bacterium]